MSYNKDHKEPKKAFVNVKKDACYTLLTNPNLFTTNIMYASKFLRPSNAASTDAMSCKQDGTINIILHHLGSYGSADRYEFHI